jgi:hypothetical protein
MVLSANVSLVKHQGLCIRCGIARKRGREGAIVHGIGNGTEIGLNRGLLAP